jgi:type 1 glutamine amidotransferase
MDGQTDIIAVLKEAGFVREGVRRKFAKDLHVILIQDTKGMDGPMYQRPPYPATWARMHGKGRVFYTSMGHGDMWNNETFHQVLVGGVGWAGGVGCAQTAALSSIANPELSFIGTSLTFV